MSEFDFLNDFLTFQLFYRLEEFPENIRFEWFRMFDVADERYGQRVHSATQAGRTMIPLSKELLREIHNHQISQNWFRMSETCFNDFVEVMNEHYAIVGVEVGIWKVFMSVPVISPEDNLQQLRIIYRIAPVQFGVESNSGNKRFIKKPKPFKLVA